MKRISSYFPFSKSLDLVGYDKPLVTSCVNNTVKGVLTLNKEVNQNEYIDSKANFNRNNSLLPDRVKSPSFHSEKLFFQNKVNGIDIIIVIKKVEENKIKKAFFV